MTAVQPGPTATKVENNPDITDDLMAQMDDERVDPETRKYFCDRVKMMSDVLKDISQPVEEVVDVIERIIDDEKPLLRYQTSEASREMARVRSQDPTGDAWIENKLMTGFFHDVND